MPEYFSEDFLADIELLPVYNFMAKWFLKNLVLPFLQDFWRIREIELAVAQKIMPG